MTTFPGSSIDLDALHAAFLAEGFYVDQTKEDGVVYGHRSDLGHHEFCFVPVMPADDSDLWDRAEALHGQAEAAVRYLWDLTGHAHCEIGSLVFRPLPL